ncbi:hypothetical protein BHE74_00043980 [Ensete ventricosum]|nr:hypothetical protein BHE74_00043980 [Ensete ventricosum]
MLQRANQYIAVEALVGGKREDQKRSYANSSQGPPSGPLRRRMEKAEPAIPRLPNTPLTSTRTENFLQIREKGLLKAPNPMKSRPEERDRGCYYHFHHDYDHDMKECYDLKNQIEDLIHRGHLSRYIRKFCKPSLHPKGLVEKQILGR